MKVFSSTKTIPYFTSPLCFGASLGALKRCFSLVLFALFANVNLLATPLSITCENSKLSNGRFSNDVKNLSIFVSSNKYFHELKAKYEDRQWSYKKGVWSTKEKSIEIGKWLNELNNIFKTNHQLAIVLFQDPVDGAIDFKLRTIKDKSYKNNKAILYPLRSDDHLDETFTLPKQIRAFNIGNRYIEFSEKNNHPTRLITNYKSAFKRYSLLCLKDKEVRKINLKAVKPKLANNSKFKENLLIEVLLESEDLKFSKDIESFIKKSNIEISKRTIGEYLNRSTSHSLVELSPNELLNRINLLLSYIKGIKK